MFDFDTIDSKALPGSFLYAGERIKLMYYAGTKARELEKTFQRIAELDDKDPEELTAEEQAIVDDGGRRAICDALANVVESVDIKDFPLDGKKMAANPKAPTSFYSLMAQAVIRELANGGVQARKSAR